MPRHRSLPASSASPASSRRRTDTLPATPPDVLADPDRILVRPGPPAGWNDGYADGFSDGSGDGFADGDALLLSVMRDLGVEPDPPTPLPLLPKRSRKH